MAFSTTKETANFFRICRLLIDEGTLVLRDVFDSIHHPDVLQDVLAYHRPELENLKKNRILNNIQWDLLFPTSPACADSSNFDITLLVFLLRHVCDLEVPANGWDDLPIATDTKLQDDIARIKFYRKSCFAHATETSMKDSDFADLWTEIRDTMVRLRAKATGTYRLKCTSMDLEAERRLRAFEQCSLDKRNTEEVKKLKESFGRVKVMSKLEKGGFVTAGKFAGKMEEMGGKASVFSGQMEDMEGKMSDKMEEVKEDISGKAGMSGKIEELEDKMTRKINVMTEIKEKSNFALICRLLIDGGTLALRNVFDSIYPPATLQAVLSKHFETLTRMRRDNILKTPDWNLLFPASPARPDSSNFSITLLVLLLRSICSLPAPANGWYYPPHKKTKKRAGRYCPYQGLSEKCSCTCVQSLHE